MSIDPDEAEYILDDFLSGHETLTLEEIKELFALFNLVVRRVELLNRPIWVTTHGGTKYIIEENNDTFDAASAENWLDSALADPLSYIEIPDDLEDFWKSPVPLYHATDSDNVESILEEGLLPDTRTRAISNKWVGPAIFTSTDPDVIDAYGDTILAIDTKAMARDGHRPPVAYEEGIAEYEARSALIHRVGMQDDYVVELDSSEGLSYDTLVVFGVIPPQYLRVLE